MTELRTPNTGPSGPETPLLPLSKKIYRTAMEAGALIMAVVVATVAASQFRPKDQTPTFSATKVDRCYVSTDWKWVQPRENYGINDLVIRNVQGVTAESGKGSRCLRAAKIVITEWSQKDNIPRNDIAYDPNFVYDQPTIQYGESYAVPLFASAKQQG